MKAWVRKLWGWPGFLGLFVLLVGAATLMPQRPYDPEAMEKLACVASAVALDQYLFTRLQAGQTVTPEITVGFKERFDRLLNFNKSLRRSDDRHIQAFRPIMIAAETARDAALAKDADAYMAAAWAEMQQCDDALFQKAAA